VIKEKVRSGETVVAVLRRKDGTKKVIREKRKSKILKILRRIFR
jgi:hypothetical protein